MDWLKNIQYQHAAANQALANRVNSASISVPVGDSPVTMPGWVKIGYFHSCIPDSQYPWDPAVLRAIREEIEPMAMPVLTRSVWRWSNYHELGKLGEPVVLVRHGIARVVRPPFPAPLEQFHIEMPTVPVPGLRISGYDIRDCRPNQLWSEWWDTDQRDHGFDLPGAYLPFDWSFFYALLDADQTRSRLLRAARMDKDEDGQHVARGAARPLIDEKKAETAAAEAHRKSEREGATAEIFKHYKDEPSDVEWKEIHGG